MSHFELLNLAVHAYHDGPLTLSFGKLLRRLAVSLDCTSTAASHPVFVVVARRIHYLGRSMSIETRKGRKKSFRLRHHQRQPTFFSLSPDQAKGKAPRPKRKSSTPKQPPKNGSLPRLRCRPRPNWGNESRDKDRRTHGRTDRQILWRRHSLVSSSWIELLVYGNNARRQAPEED